MDESCHQNGMSECLQHNQYTLPNLSSDDQHVSTGISHSFNNTQSIATATLEQMEPADASNPRIDAFKHMMSKKRRREDRDEVGASNDCNDALKSSTSASADAVECTSTEAATSAATSAATVGDTKAAATRADTTTTSSCEDHVMFSLQFANCEALRSWAHTLNENSKLAFVRLYADASARFQGIRVECRSDTQVVDNVALFSHFACKVECGKDKHGVPLRPETLKNYSFAINTTKLHECVSMCVNKSNKVSATVFYKMWSPRDGMMLNGFDVGLVWKSEAATCDTTLQCAQPLLNPKETVHADFGANIDYPLTQVFQVRFGMNLKSLKHLFERCKAVGAKMVTIELSEVGASSGSDLHHWRLKLAFDQPDTRVPVEQNTYVTMREEREESVDNTASSFLTVATSRVSNGSNSRASAAAAKSDAISNATSIATGEATGAAKERAPEDPVTSLCVAPPPRVVLKQVCVGNISIAFREKLPWQLVCSNSYCIDLILKFLKSVTEENGTLLLFTGECRNSQPFMMEVTGVSQGHFLNVAGPEQLALEV